VFLTDSLVILIPIDKDNGHTLAALDVKCEWNPPRCTTCKIFDHHSDKCPNVFNHLDWTSNGTWCNKGTRIIMGWNYNDVNVVVIDQDDKVIHTRIWLKNERKEVFCSFIYAHNRYTHHRSLWRSLSKLNIYIHHRPWSIMGDFNVSLYLEESMACGSNRDVAMRDFHDCMEDIEMLDVQKFNEVFMGAHAMFKPYRVSDQTLSILCIPTLGKTEWDHYISGFFMLRVVKKLKNLKNPMRKLLYDKGNVHANVNKLRTDLDAIQTVLDADPFNVVLRKREATCVIEFNEAEGETSNFNYANLFNVRLSDQEALNMVREISNQEVKDAIFSISDDKSPGPDGFIVAFFKEAWNIITNDVYLVELMHNYHLERCTPRCSFKVDIQKVYDTMDWDILRIIILGFGFHQKMVSLIMECVTSTLYSICVNGSLHGYFKCKWGLRQRDLTDQFTYHMYCSKMELVNLCFADDLFLFAYGDVGSASIIKKALDEFKNASGLVPSLPKNVIHHGLWVWPQELLVKYPFLNNYNTHIREDACDSLVWHNIHGNVKKFLVSQAWDDIRDRDSKILSFEEGKLPVKYLGVPLVSSRLMIRDCNELVDKVQIPYETIPLESRIVGEDARDSLVWRNIHVNVKKFLVSQVWDDIRHRDSKVNWYNMVWFPSCIPRHAINFWLIIRKKLKTQDLVPMWDVSDSLGMVCSLCESVPDSHDNLFFECPVVAKLVVAATTYYVWQERNWRLFKKGKRSPDQIVECIKSSVRLKLLSCKLKKSKNGERLARLWDLPETVFK
nr:hypothetical protein [Tanacetum cinerariifolium]